jgi:hypothetical protein
LLRYFLHYYEQFIGKPGHYSVGNIGATGILKEMNFEEGYMAIQPSLVGYGETGVRIETEEPTIITFVPSLPISRRPLREGDLENILEERRSKIESNNNEIDNSQTNKNK